MRIVLCAAAVLGLASAGCRVRVREHSPGPDRVVVYDVDHCPDPDGKIVVIQHGHIHDAQCGHYWHNGRWYVMHEHHHGHGCGHHFHEGAWVLAGAVKIGAAHVHSAHCGHYHHGGQWYYVKGHVHAHGCGHRLDGKIWIAVRF